MGSNVHAMAAKPPKPAPTPNSTVCPTPAPCPVCPVVVVPTPTPTPTPVPTPTTPPTSVGKVYEVGAGKPYTTLGAVPFETLKAGETVLIHCGTYKEKLFLSEQGTASAPITVKGVRCSDGTRPVIDGEGATTRSAYKYRYSNMDARGLITISQESGDAWGYKPKHIVIQGLTLKNANMLYKFKNAAGAEVAYTQHAASIYVERGENIAVKDVELSYSGNGFFVASGGSEEVLSRNISLEDSIIHNNGNSGSDREHGIYTEAVGMTFLRNKISPLRAGALGSAFKDRSAGLVFKYNRVEGGARTLDLVEAQESIDMVKNLPEYRTTVVEGNLLVAGTPGPTNLVHYGGDSGLLGNYRKGVLQFNNNTIIVNANQTGTGSRWRTQILDVSTNEEKVVAANNVVHVSPATTGSVPTGTAWSSGAGDITLSNVVSNIPLADFRDGITPTGEVKKSGVQVAPGLSFTGDYKVVGFPGLGW